MSKDKAGGKKSGKGGKAGHGGAADGDGGDEAGSEASVSGSKAASAKERSETEEILDSILPPREWEEEGQLWRQSVSSTPATRLDVINLQVR